MSLAFARYVQVWEDINSQKENKKYALTDFDLNVFIMSTFEN